MVIAAVKANLRCETNPKSDAPGADDYSVDRGLFIAASGLLANQQYLDIISNNLSNADTPGYKGDKVTQANFGDMLLQNVGSGAPIGPLSQGDYIRVAGADLTEGTLKETGRSLDLAIQGTGFFAIQTPQGVRYTRNGTFDRDAAGFLTTSDGSRVLGVNNQPIRIPSDNVQIGSDGAITNANARVGQIAVVDLNNVKQAGSNLFTGTPARRSASQVVQGSLEQSNIDPIQEMTAMTQVLRSYESSQRVLTTIDSTLNLAANDVGKLG